MQKENVGFMRRGCKGYEKGVCGVRSRDMACDMTDYPKGSCGFTKLAVYG
jgi:hypothetical protein